MNPITAYREAFERHDVAYMRKIVVDFVSRDNLDLPHPIHSEIPCICRSGLMQGMANILFYSDKDGGNKWCLVQGVDFISCVITETEILKIGRMAQVPNMINPIIRSFRAGRFDAQFKKNDTYGGLTLGSNRPYHYFYDQAIHLPDLLPLLPESRRRIAITPQAFLSPGISFNCVDRPASNTEFYLLGTVVHSWGWRNIDKKSFYETAKKFETALNGAIEPRPLDREYDLILWSGISAQKRAWLNQVEGHINIIKELKKRFPRLLLLIDGFTAPVGKTIDAPDDMEVVRAIINGIGDTADIISLVGMDYPNKIAACKTAQVFIANAGTGCMVPLRFCQLPGVLHSNHTLKAFGDDEYGENVIFTGRDSVTEANREEGKDHALISYDVDWRSVYNRLVVVLRNLGHKNLHMVDADILRDGLENDVRMAVFSDLPRTLGKKPNPIKIVCEVARRLDKLGNTEAARSILTEAGPLIGYRSPEDKSIFKKYAIDI